MRIEDIHPEATRSASREIGAIRRTLRTIVLLWVAFWSVFGPLSFFVWIGYYYHWGG